MRTWALGVYKGLMKPQESSALGGRQGRNIWGSGANSRSTTQRVQGYFMVVRGGIPSLPQGVGGSSWKYLAQWACEGSGLGPGQCGGHWAQPMGVLSPSGDREQAKARL